MMTNVITYSICVKNVTLTLASVGKYGASVVETVFKKWKGQFSCYITSSLIKVLHQSVFF